jgi:hypothetical protein
MAQAGDMSARWLLSSVSHVYRGRFDPDSQSCSEFPCYRMQTKVIHCRRGRLVVRVLVSTMFDGEAAPWSGRESLPILVVASVGCLCAAVLQPGLQRQSKQRSQPNQAKRRRQATRTHSVSSTASGPR